MVASFLTPIAEALEFAFAMTWEVLWALVLGFALSAVVQAVVSKGEISRLLPDDAPRSLAIACGLGAASSSCSYAAVALARSIFRKGADFTAAMTFEFASTNLVIELGILLAVLLGWQFTLAEFVGGPIMIVILALLFRAFLRPELVELARRQADKGILGVMEGHAEMDMSVGGGSILSRVRSRQGFTAISHYYVMDWASIWKDIALGLLIAGALAAWVPESFWQGFFLVDHPLLSKIWGPLIGPIVAMLSFVCSIGNVPLAAVLWNGGISFGGVAAFIFADLIILPILNIYRKYYGRRMSLFLLATFYTSMVVAGMDRRGALPGVRVGARRTQRRRDHGRGDLELHDVPQHRVPRALGGAGRAVPPHRRPADAPDDEDAGPGARGRARGTRRPRAAIGRGGRGLCLPDASGGPGRTRGPLPDMRHAARAARRFEPEADYSGVDMQEQVTESGPVVVEATDQNFLETVIEESKKRPVVVDLWASWCGPCRTLGPILEKVAGERGGSFLLAKLDVDANPYTAGQFGVQSIPTVVAFRDGQPIDGFVGAIPEPMVNEFVDKLMPTEAELEAEEALEEELEGHLDDAEQKYREALEVDPTNRDARVGLARIYAETGREDLARETLAPALPDPEAERILAMLEVRGWANLTEPGTLASAQRLAAQGTWREALDAMLGALPDDPDARQAMLEVFTVLGEDDELVAEYRRKLAAALF